MELKDCIQFFILPGCELAASDREDQHLTAETGRDDLLRIRTMDPNCLGASFCFSCRPASPWPGFTCIRDKHAFFFFFFFFGAGLNGTKPTLAWLDGNNAPTTERRRRRLEDYLSVTCPGLVEWRIK